MSHSLGTDAGLQKFLNTLASHYVRVCNQVLKESKKSAAQLKVEIDPHLYAVDISIAPELLVTCWNATTTDPSMIITNDEGRIKDCIFKWKYFWCLGPLMTACKQVLAEEIRNRFDTAEKVTPYVSDKVT